MHEHGANVVSGQVVCNQICRTTVGTVVDGNTLRLALAADLDTFRQIGCTLNDNDLATEYVFAQELLQVGNDFSSGDSSISLFRSTCDGLFLLAGSSLSGKASHLRIFLLRRTFLRFCGRFMLISRCYTQRPRIVLLLADDGAFLTDTRGTVAAHHRRDGLGGLADRLAVHLVVGYVASQEVTHLGLLVGDHEQLGAVHLGLVLVQQELVRVLAHVDAAERVAAVGRVGVLQGGGALGGVLLLEPDRVHDGDHGVRVFKGEHLAEVVLASRLGGRATLGGVDQLETEQTSRGDAVLRQVVVALVEITLGQTEQGLLLDHQITLGVEHENLAARFVGNGYQLVSDLGRQRRDQRGVGLLASLGHTLDVGRQLSLDLAGRGDNRSLRHDHERLGRSDVHRVEDHGD